MGAIQQYAVAIIDYLYLIGKSGNIYVFTLFPSHECLSVLFEVTPV